MGEKLIFHKLIIKDCDANEDFTPWLVIDPRKDLGQRYIYFISLKASK